MERGIFGLDALYGTSTSTKVSPPPGLTLGDFEVKHVNRFKRERGEIKLTNSYTALQCCEEGNCVKCEVSHEKKGELNEVFNFEREINSAENSYTEGEWGKS